MCIGENNAPHAEHYANAQLGALWDNATECVAHHGKGIKPAENQRYSFALAEYYYGKHRNTDPAATDMMFHASFGKPYIEFICNHDAIIHLSLKNGHYNTEFAKGDNRVSSAEHNRTFTDDKASFRVPFKITTVVGQGGKIVGGNHVINVFVFDFHQAQPINISASDEIGFNALTFYLKHYLRFLSNAGHRILFSLPDFDDDNLSVFIDFSAVSKTTALVEEVHGVSLEKVNTFLSTAWLNAAMLATGENAESDIKISLAEYRSTMGTHNNDLHFTARFGAPRVEALCNQEVILYFKIEELCTYESDDFSEEPDSIFEDYEIAFLVNLVTTFEENDNVVHCRLDFDSTHFVHHHCKFPGLDDEEDSDKQTWARVLEFFKGTYFDILERGGYQVAYHHDYRLPKHTTGHFGGFPDHPDAGSPISPALGDGGIEGAQDVSPWKEGSEKVDMHGFDQITVISQGSINSHFQQLWLASQTSDESSLFKWSYDQYFKATFKPIQVRLLSNERAIIWITLQEGSLKTLRDWRPSAEGDEHSFKDWSLAFEVDIKIADHTNVFVPDSPGYRKFEASEAFKEHGNQSDRVLRHVYLDLSSAVFLHEFSSFAKLFENIGSHPIDQVKAAVTYLKKDYFNYVKSTGYHILSTIPVWKVGSTPPSYGWTACHFYVYSKHLIERHTWGTFTGTDEPSIVIIGTTGFRPLPAETLDLDFPINNIGRTVCISRKAFIEERLQTFLCTVNALTTIVPATSFVDDDEWKVDLTTWQKRWSSDGRKNRICNWVAVEDCANALKYRWWHRDQWQYLHEGSDHIRNGGYTISCVTENFLEIPTLFNKDALEIKLRGTVSVKLSYNGVTSGAWSSDGGACWATSLLIKSDACGLKIEAESPSISYTRALSGEKINIIHPDPETLLKSQLPTTVDLSGVVGELKTLEGVWNGCYAGSSAYQLSQPVFNSNGDFLFKLRPFSTAPKVAPKPGSLGIANGAERALQGKARSGSSQRSVSRNLAVPRPKSFSPVVPVGDRSRFASNGNDNHSESGRDSPSLRSTRSDLDLSWGA